MGASTRKPQAENKTSPTNSGATRQSESPVLSVRRSRSSKRERSKGKRGRVRKREGQKETQLFWQKGWRYGSRCRDIPERSSPVVHTSRKALGGSLHIAIGPVQLGEFCSCEWRRDDLGEVLL